VIVEPRDPFGEHIARAAHGRVSVLGAEILLESTDAVLTEIAYEAYRNLPRFDRHGTPTQLHISMVLNEHEGEWPKNEEPPSPILSSGGGLLCATVDAGNFVVVDVAKRRALICVSRAMLHHRQLVRYEMIEFAVLTLAARSRSLVPLHAACIGLGDSGCLIFGASGTGKSTLCLLALCNGLEVISEDSTFVDPESLEIFGVPNYLHVKPETIDLIGPGPLHDLVAGSPVIRRRSGAVKFEADLRGLVSVGARSPFRLAAAIFLTPDLADSGLVKQRIDSSDVVSRIDLEQPYAAGLPGWDRFCAKLVDHPCYELRRTSPPAAVIRELQQLLE